MTRLVTLNVNGRDRPVDVLPNETLIHTLRYKLGDENIWAYELTTDQSAISMTQSLDRAVVNSTR